MSRPTVRFRGAFVAMIVILAASAGEAATARPRSGGEPGDARPGALVRQRMQRLFAVRLKADVGLDDAAVDRVLPKIDSLEQDRTRIQRERRRVVRELRRGLETGMSDPEMQRRLDALDGLSRDLEATTARALSDIDRDLTVPQRVKLRFLVVAFRAEMARRLEEFRDGSRPGAGRRPVPPDADPPSPPE